MQTLECSFNGQRQIEAPPHPLCQLARDFSPEEQLLAEIRELKSLCRQFIELQAKQLDAEDRGLGGVF